MNGSPAGLDPTRSPPGPRQLCPAQEHQRGITAIIPGSTRSGPAHNRSSSSVAESEPSPTSNTPRSPTLARCPQFQAVHRPVRADPQRSFLSSTLTSGGSPLGGRAGWGGRSYPRPATLRPSEERGRQGEPRHGGPIWRSREQGVVFYEPPGRRASERDSPEARRGRPGGTHEDPAG